MVRIRFDWWCYSSTLHWNNCFSRICLDRNFRTAQMNTITKMGWKRARLAYRGTYLFKSDLTYSCFHAYTVFFSVQTFGVQLQLFLHINVYQWPLCFSHCCLIQQQQQQTSARTFYSLIFKEPLDLKTKQLLMVCLPPAGLFCGVVYFSFVAGQISTAGWYWYFQSENGVWKEKHFSAPRNNKI